MAKNSPEVRTTQFRQMEVVQGDPEIAISTGWDSIDRTNWKIEETGNGSVDPGQGGGLYGLNVTDADGDVAAIKTVDRVEYVPSMAALWGFAFIADSYITEDQEFRAGLTNRPTWRDSYQYRIIGTPAGQDNDHYLVIRKGGSDSIVRQWDTWGSDPRNIGWDETIGCILRSELGWYDFGEWKPEMQIPDLLDDDTNSIIDIVENPNPDVRKVNVPLEQLSPVAETATDNVNFRIRFELQNVGPNAGATRVQVGNPHYNILGQNEPNPRSKDVERNGGGIGGGNITTTQPYPLVAIRGTEDDVKMLLRQITITPGTDNVEINAYLMDRSDVTFVTGPDADLGPPPGLDTRECFFEDTGWNGIDTITRFDAPGTGNNQDENGDPVGTEGYPYGRKIAGSTVIGGSGANKTGEQGGLDANAQLTDLDYLVIVARATETDGISLQALDYEMAVDR
jgi:hypothetical protein